MSTSKQLTQFWIDFLELYRSLPQLWNLSHEDYQDRSARQTAYEIMLEKYQEFDEGATVEHVKKKISNMRSSFRREFRKVQEDNTYKPMLWYYQNLVFLKEQEKRSNESNNGDIYGNQKMKGELIKLNCLPPPRKRKQKNSAHDDESKRQSCMTPSSLIQNENQQYSYIEITPLSSSSSPSSPHINTQDEAKTLSASWEVLYGYLDSQQGLYANRLITEVLYLGALKKLNSRTYKIFENLRNQTNYLENSLDKRPADSSNSGRKKSAPALNINDALNKLQQLENYALQENHEALEIIIQLEEILKNSTADPLYVKDDDGKDYEPDDEAEDD